MDGTRLKRVSDLFVEGTECYLGDDDEGKPVVIWVNKLNSFEVDEAKRDGTIRRAERIAELARPDSPELRGLLAEIGLWTDEQVREAYVGGQDDRLYLEALADLEVDPKFREAQEYIRRAPGLMADDDLATNDPRYLALEEANQTYMTMVSEAQAQKQRELLADLAELPRKDVEKSFIEQWRERRTLDEYMSGRRITEIYLSARECNAALVTVDLTGKRIWDHKPCDHMKRFFSERKNVTQVSERLIQRIVDTLSDVTANDREAGNSDAPASSSASSEQSNGPEDQSTPSTPDEAPSDAPTT